MKVPSDKIRLPNSLNPLSLFLRFRDMRNYFYLLLVMMIPAVLMGQEPSKDKKVREKQRIFLEGSLGVSTPLGSYMTDDRQDKKSGFARTGYLFQATCDWMGKKDLGLAIQYSYQHNPIASSAKNDTLPGRTFPLGTGSWSNHYIMIGPVYYKELNKFTLDVKLLGGVVLAFSPLFSYTSPDSTLKTVTNYGSGFSYQFAVGGGYSLSSRLRIKLDISFLGAIATFSKHFGGDYLETVPARDPETGEILRDEFGRIIYVDVYSPLISLDLKNIISTFNASIGVIFKL
jgi:hypothetical protein